MHRKIRHNLEDYLKGSGKGIPAEVQAHLGECTECSGELKIFQEQSELLRSLGSVPDIEPRAGFYARVMERIEAQPASIWAVFLDRKFGFRLAVASAALVALMGAYLVTSEPSGPESSAPAIVFTDASQTAPANAQDDSLRQEQQRDAVLVNLASYHQ